MEIYQPKDQPSCLQMLMGYPVKVQTDGESFVFMAGWSNTPNAEEPIRVNNVAYKLRLRVRYDLDRVGLLADQLKPVLPGGDVIAQELAGSGWFVTWADQSRSLLRADNGNVGTPKAMEVIARMALHFSRSFLEFPAGSFFLKEGKLWRAEDKLGRLKVEKQEAWERFGDLDEKVNEAARDALAAVTDLEGL